MIVTYAPWPKKNGVSTLQYVGDDPIEHNVPSKTEVVARRLGYVAAAVSGYAYFTGRRKLSNWAFGASLLLFFIELRAKND